MSERDNQVYFWLHFNGNNASDSWDECRIWLPLAHSFLRKVDKASRISNFHLFRPGEDW